MTRKVIRFIISSMIYTLNSTDLSEKEIDDIINLELNTIINILQPEYALVFIEELLIITGNLETFREIENQEVIQEIITKMKDI